MMIDICISKLRKVVAQFFGGSTPEFGIPLPLKATAPPMSENVITG